MSISIMAVAATLAGAATAVTLARRKAQRRQEQVVAILLPEGPNFPIPPEELLLHRPEVDAEVLTGCTPDDFGAALDSITAITWIPGAKVEVLAALYAKTPRCCWLHTFSAGVDYVASFIASLPAHVQVSNGRGAFSSSLGEYVMAAALHFNKQVPRCIANRKAKRWDKFVMPVLAGKTMGFVGFGSIAQTSAKLARAFGMRVLALRRHPKAADEGSRLADEVFGLEQADAFYAQCDFVVSTLPGTPETRDMIGAAAFRAMRSSVVFISLGRGVVVDEAGGPSPPRLREPRLGRAGPTCIHV